MRWTWLGKIHMQTISHVKKKMRTYSAFCYIWLRERGRIWMCWSRSLSQKSVAVIWNQDTIFGIWTGLQFTGLHRAGHNWSDLACMHAYTRTHTHKWNHCAVHLKLTQHCKSAILQYIFLKSSKVFIWLFSLWYNIQMQQIRIVNRHCLLKVSMLSVTKLARWKFQSKKNKWSNYRNLNWNVKNLKSQWSFVDVGQEITMAPAIHLH